MIDFFNNKNEILKILLIIYILFINKIIPYINKFVYKSYFKFILILIILYCIHIDIQLSILLLFAFLLTLHQTNKNWIEKNII
jgi:hypothetical protein